MRRYHPFVLIALILFWCSVFSHAAAGVGSTAKDLYFEADACQRKLRSAPQMLKYRQYWLSCIEKFQMAYQKDPSGAYAPAALFMSGQLYLDLYSRSAKPSDKKEAVDIFERIIKRFPKSAYKNKAAEAMRRAFKTATQAKSEFLATTKENKKPASGGGASGKKPASGQTDIQTLLSETSGQSISIERPREEEAGEKTTLPKTATLVTGIRFWSNPNYTRVVVDADGQTTVAHMVLKKDSSINKPERLVVDLRNSRLKKDIEKLIPVDDNLLSDVRAGQYTLDVVRVVIDIKSMKTYKVFSLENPYRVVVDLWGGKAQAIEAQVQSSPRKKGEKLTPGALAKQLALGVSRIIIDPGHGGKDYGAPGYLKGIHEKHVILQIGKRLAEKIKRSLNCEVILTRDRDRYLTLEERTAFANTKNADLFISLHANSSTDKRAFGIETYYLNLATDDESIMVAARENATSTKNISDLQMILNDLMQNAKINESSRLATHVQESLCSRLKIKYDRIKNKGVKQAPFYVLLGAQMPAILIETSFISNERECRRLTNEKYQEHLCDAVLTGIRNYIQEINPTALLNVRPKG